MHTSSPKPRPKLPPSKNPTLRILVINFQSLRNKGKLLECVIEDTDPDIIMGTETWLDTGLKSSEILPYQLGYDIQRRDRPNDPHGGVLIASKSHLQIGDVIVSPSFELLSANITLEKKKFRIAAFYRPPNKTDYLQTVKNELSQLKARCKKTPLLIGEISTCRHTLEGPNSSQFSICKSSKHNIPQNHSRLQPRTTSRLPDKERPHT